MLKLIRMPAAQIFVAAVVLALVAAALLADDSSRFANMIFVVIGGLLTVGTTLIVEETKQTTKVNNLAKALHIELADRVARCCFDFEAPWAAYTSGAVAKPMGRFRLLKFEPLSPVIYKSAASEIAMLSPSVPEKLVRFYYCLDAWRRDLVNSASEWDPQSGPPGSVTSLLAMRLHQTLQPGIAALEALGAQVDAAEAIENAALAAYDVHRPVAYRKTEASLRLRLRTIANAFERAQPPGKV